MHLAASPRLRSIARPDLAHFRGDSRVSHGTWSANSGRAEAGAGNESINRASLAGNDDTSSRQRVHTLPIGIDKSQM